MNDRRKWDWGEVDCDDCGEPWTVNRAVVKGSYVCPTCRDERRVDAEHEAEASNIGTAA
jgi:formylmethanofuran dehydrogenase subunit E